jgi:hypothetical protein
MKIAKSLITFGPDQGGPREDYAEVSFPEPVSMVGCMLTGFKISYTNNGGDHHLGYMDVRVRAEPLDAWRVRVTADFGLRDHSGWWDDQYQGTVYFTVVGE